MDRRPFWLNMWSRVTTNNVLKFKGMFTSIVGFVDHADVVSDKRKVTDGHLLVDEAGSICCYEDAAAHVCREKSRECLLVHSIPLIVVDTPVPDECVAPLHDCV